MIEVIGGIALVICVGGFIWAVNGAVREIYGIVEEDEWDSQDRWFN